MPPSLTRMNRRLRKRAKVAAADRLSADNPEPYLAVIPRGAACRQVARAAVSPALCGRRRVGVKRRLATHHRRCFMFARMRSFHVLSALLLALGLIGCEDGQNAGVQRESQ